METSYVQTFGSFVRNGKYPLEADYIFNSVEALKEWEQRNRKYLHEGLFKVVITEDTQTLYWYYNGSFTPLLNADSLDKLVELLGDSELHGSLRDLLKDLQAGYNSRLKAIQQELDQTQNGVGLNGDGSFDQLSMKNTNYLDGSRSVIEALKALDRAVVNGGSTPVGDLSLTWEDNKIKLLQGEEVISEIDGTDFIKDGMLDRVALNQSSKILTLIFNTDSGKQNIPIDLSTIIKAYDGSNVILTPFSIPQNYTAPSTGDSVNTIAGKFAAGISNLQYQLDNQVVTSVNGQKGNVVIPTPTIPTKVSAFENDANYLTEHQSLENYYTKPEVDQAIDEKITGGAVDLSNYYNKGEIDTKFADIEFPEDYIVSGTQTTTSAADGGNNVFTFTTKEGTTKTFVVKNGSKGSQGIQGPKGDAFTYDDFTTDQLALLKGEKGDQGIQGEIGPKGDKGDPGKDGTGISLKSSQEECTEVGDAYLATNGHIMIWNGSSFTDGGEIKGPKGDQGEQGPKGDTGAQGPAGTAAGFGTPTATVDANTGTPSVTVTATGANTAKVFNFNFKNLKGEKGDQGERGLQGVQGAKGDAGDSAKLAIGTVQSGASAAATITGTAPNYVLNLTLPKGEKGDPGDGSDVDLSSYYTKTEVDGQLNTVVTNFNSYKNGVQTNIEDLYNNVNTLKTTEPLVIHLSGTAEPYTISEEERDLLFSDAGTSRPVFLKLVDSASAGAHPVSVGKLANSTIQLIYLGNNTRVSYSIQPNSLDVQRTTTTIITDHIKGAVLTQTEFDNLSTKNSNYLYIVK